MLAELTKHVWQSTLFAFAAGLVTVAFRKNRAHVRYWLWFGRHLEWAPVAQEIAAPAYELCHVGRRDNQFAAIHMPPSDEPAGPSIFAAMQERLGLKLEPARGPREFLVVDHVERPTGN